MKNRWPLVLLALCTLTTSAIVMTRPWVRSHRQFQVIDQLGYRVRYEYDPKTHHIHLANPERNGTGLGGEHLSVIVQGHYSLQIIDGVLTVSREPRGRVEKGDRLEVTLDHRVWVNGVERTR